MRRLIGPVASLLLLLCFAIPSEAWLFHHARHHHAAPVAQPVAVPLTLGFQLPGGVQLTTQFDPQNLLHRGNQAGSRPPDRQTPARVTVSKDVAAKIDRIATDVDSALDKINKLSARVNERLPEGQKLAPLEKAKKKTVASGAVSEATDTPHITKSKPFED